MVRLPLKASLYAFIATAPTCTVPRTSSSILRRTMYMGTKATNTAVTAIMVSCQEL